MGTSGGCTSLGTVFCWRRTFLCRRRRRGFPALILGRFLLRYLQFVDDLLQGRDRAFHRFELPVGRVEFLLMVGGEFGNRLLQEIDVALQAASAPLHGLFDRAYFDAGSILR